MLAGSLKSIPDAPSAQRPAGEPSLSPAHGTVREKPSLTVAAARFAVYAPPRMRGGQHGVLEVWAYRPELHEDVAKEAMRGGRVELLASKGPISIEVGRTLTVTILEGHLRKALRRIRWRRRVGKAGCLHGSPERSLRSVPPRAHLPPTSLLPRGSGIKTSGRCSVGGGTVVVPSAAEPIFTPSRPPHGSGISTSAIRSPAPSSRVFAQRIQLHRLAEALLRFHPSRDAGGVIVSGHDDHWDSPDGLVRELSPPELLTRHDRHHQIEDDQAGKMRPCHVVGFHAIRCHDNGGTRKLQRQCEHLPHVGIVFHEQNRTRWHLSQISGLQRVRLSDER